MALASFAGPPNLSHARVIAFIAPESKALLMSSQALLHVEHELHYSVMLDSTEMARRFKVAFPLRGGAVSDRQIADECRVTPQAVAGWRKTGRIAKKHLLVLARLSGRGERYWLGDDTAIAAPQAAGWPESSRVLDLWSDLTPEQRADWLQKLEALVAANRKIAEHLQSRIVRTPNQEVADAFGEAGHPNTKKFAAEDELLQHRNPNPMPSRPTKTGKKHQ